ncbi:MAG TPA: PAS domain S-box protein [Pseudomonadota bacterium]|nr:PAS domain S-box protein [Pseudomonadota bacterium]
MPYRGSTQLANEDICGPGTAVDERALDCYSVRSQPRASAGLGSVCARSPSQRGENLPPATPVVAAHAGLDDIAVLRSRLRRTSQLYTTLMACVRMGQSPQSRSSLFAETCRILVEHGGFALARIEGVDRPQHLLVPVAEAGIRLDDGGPGESQLRGFQPGPAAEVLHSGQTYVFDDVAASSHSPAWRQAMLHAGLLSGAALPIRLGADIPFILFVYSRESASCPPEVVELLQSIADGTSLMLAIAAQEESRQQAERAVRGSERQLQLLLRHCPVALAMFDRDMRYLYVSQRWLTEFGLVGQAVIGRLHYELFPNLPAHWKVHHQRALAGEVLREAAVRFELGDGRVVWLRREVRPWYTDDESIGGLVIYSEDITASRQAEAGLQLQSAALAAAVNAMAISGADGIIEWVNPAFLRISGFDESELLGKSLHELVDTGVQDAAVYRKLWSTISQGQPFQGELVNRRKDGSQYNELMSITPLRDGSGQISHYIVIKQDISEQKRLEALLLRTQRLESVGRLAGGLAHDLNNLLMPMLMAPPVLRMFVQDPIALESLDSIETCAQRGANIIRQLLTFSRGQPGVQVPVELRLLLRDMAKIVHEAFPKNITLHQAVAREIAQVQGDATQIHQVLMNLCVNARDAMPGGGNLSLSLQNVDVSAERAAVHGVAPGLYVLLTVGDTGIGIAEANIEKIFDPFYTTKPSSEGTGLGLSTSLGIVQGHHGFIEVESTLGRGSEFRVYLPAHDLGAAGASAAPTAALPHGQGQLILVVDDEDLARRVTCRILEQYGYRTLEASNGTEGLRVFRGHRHALRVVITDLMMPLRDGVSFIHDLAGEPPQRSPVPVIAVTGYISDSKSIEAVNRISVATLMKPFSAESLLSAISKALHESH